MRSCLLSPCYGGKGKETRQRAQELALLEERIQVQETTIQRLSVELQKAGAAYASDRV